jgi:N-acetylglucosaminyldiphosphoundecaprenol N-acetyl-beta-D-mannosaminyltransferase
MKKADDISGKVFFLGSSEETLSLMKERAKIEYQNIEIETYSPPYKNDFSDEDNTRMIHAVNNFNPHLLCIGMTAPKQEKWAYRHYKKLDADIVISIGQVFDWYAGTMDEPNPRWTKLHLLWLIRVIKRPAILKRYPMILKFAWHLFLNAVGIRKD